MPKNLWLAAAWLWTVCMAVLCLVRFGKLPDVGLEGADKYVHVSLHFVFVVLWHGYYNTQGRLPERKILVRALSFSILYGCLIEIAQEWLTTTRQADLKDVIANFAGAALAVILLLAGRWLRKRRTTE